MGSFWEKFGPKGRWQDRQKNGQSLLDSVPGLCACSDCTCLSGEKIVELSLIGLSWVFYPFCNFVCSRADVVDELDHASDSRLTNAITVYERYY